MWTAFAIGLAVPVLLGLARASMRSVTLAAGVTLALTYFAFPFSTSVGFVSRDTVKPTLFGMTPYEPLLAVVLVAAVAAMLAPFWRPRLGAVVAALGAAASVAVIVWWRAQQPDLVLLRPVHGLMEVLIGAMLFIVLAGLGWKSRRLRWPALVVGLAVGVLTSTFLASPAGDRLFPNSIGYYRLTASTTNAEQTGIVEAYNANLDVTNAQRQRIGLKPLPAIEGVGGLATERLPEEAASVGYRMLRPAESGYGVGIAFLLLGLMGGAGVMLFLRPLLIGKRDLMLGAVMAGAISMLAPAFAATEFGFTKLIEGWPFFLNFLRRSWPPLLADPNFSQFGIFPLQEVASQMLITLEIALVGTFLGALIAIPMSFLAARNVTSGNAFMRTVYFLTRGFFNLDRGVDTLILALVFVATVGLGPLAGVLAMAIHSIADLGKLYSESIENVDKGPIEALESVGASGSNVVRWAILPQVSPLFLGWTLYRFEINFRVSIVLGLVGAGGIGFFIQDKMASGKYDQMIIAIIAIVIVVNIIDFISSWARSKLV